MSQRWSRVEGVVKRGHQIASGLAQDSPYEAGSIQLQAPFFQEKGLDLSSYYPGTINLSIAPQTFVMRQPFWQIEALEWTCHHPPETFSFCHSKLWVGTTVYSGLIYYPHPDTKETHFQDNCTLEILAPRILGLNYGDRLGLSINPDEIEILEAAV